MLEVLEVLETSTILYIGTAESHYKLNPDKSTLLLKKM